MSKFFASLQTQKILARLANRREKRLQGVAKNKASKEQRIIKSSFKAATKKRPKAKQVTRTRSKKAGRGGSLAEVMVHERLEEEGYTVLHRGWPDFCAIRDSEIRFIEVKCLGDKLSEAQQQLHLILKLLGIEVEVIHQVLDYSYKPKP